MPQFPQHEADRLGARLSKDLKAAAETAAPWFVRNMPPYYLRTHTEDEILRHLKALTASRAIGAAGRRQTMTLTDDDGAVTYLSPGCGMDQLIHDLSRHTSQNIETARVYASLDESLRLHTFLPAPQPRCDTASDAFARAVAETVDQGHIPAGEREAFAAFLAGASADYLARFDPARAGRHFLLGKDLADHNKGGEDVNLLLQPLPDRGLSRLTLAMHRPPPTGLMLQAAKVLNRAGLDVARAYADHFQCCGGAGLSLMSFYVHKGGRPLELGQPAWERAHKDLRVIKWFAPHGLERLADERGWSLRRVMLAQAAGEFAHQFLIKEDLYAYTSDNVTEALLAHPELLERLVAVFHARFDPRAQSQAGDGDNQEALTDEVREAARRLDDASHRRVFATVLDFFGHTLRTNYFLPGVYGLCFRLDPAFLCEQAPPGKEAHGEEAHGERPYGIFFHHGPASLGFHVRFRETARGGLRLVAARNQERFEIESNRLFDEARDLALAQQYKNKDIPEGGAKAVLLLGPEADPDLAFMSFVDGLLDCTLPGRHGPALAGVRDYLGREETLYLGPDERITPSHITWAVERAAKRGHARPTTFMSSKPGAGISHKEYGVTSLGVMVFAEEVLGYLGLDPKTEPFTVKLTGGPGGDVAGNCLKILARDHRETARVVAVSDGHGAAYDPEGLDWRELLRLVDEERSMDAFATAKLRGEGAFVVSAENEEGAARRSELPLTAKADLFIPAGGRPHSVNADNWRRFLDTEGRPTARAVVEGANIYFDDDAREGLQDAGVLMVHGSSANKCGVICSSYEILAGLALSEEEFLEHKERFVAEVLTILDQRARAEARRMLDEHRARGGKTRLTDLSMALSKEINTLADRLEAVLREAGAGPQEDADLARLVAAYCPPLLGADYARRLVERVPRPHLYALAAHFAAARLVYAEGLGWFSRLAEVRDPMAVVRAYLAAERRLADHVAAIRTAGLQNAEDMARVLTHGGRAFLTVHELGLAWNTET